MLNLLYRLLLDWGLGDDLAAPVARAAAIVLVALAALIAHRLARGPVLRAIDAVIRRTSNNWDDIIVERRALLEEAAVEALDVAREILLDAPLSEPRLDHRSPQNYDHPCSC